LGIEGRKQANAKLLGRKGVQAFQEAAIHYPLERSDSEISGERI
jgi:hypothetical protein